MRKSIRAHRLTASRRRPCFTTRRRLRPALKRPVGNDLNTPNHRARFCDTTRDKSECLNPNVETNPNVRNPSDKNTGRYPAAAAQHLAVHWYVREHLEFGFSGACLSDNCARSIWRPAKSGPVQLVCRTRSRGGICLPSKAFVTVGSSTAVGESEPRDPAAVDPGALNPPAAPACAPQAH